MSKYKYSGGFDVVELLYKHIQKGEFEFAISKVLYENPVTIVMWDDGTKTVSKCAEGDIYSKETGLTICLLKKVLGATPVHKMFEDWIPKNQEDIITLSEVRKKYKKAKVE